MGDDWVTTVEGAKLTGYTEEHVRLLARTGQVEAQKKGRDWWVKRAALLEYAQTVKRGRKPKSALTKHQPVSAPEDTLKAKSNPKRAPKH